MIIFLYGEDTYRSAQKLQEIKEEFKAKRDPSGLNIATLDGENFDLEKFNNAASQGGFLTTKRLIVVKNLFNAKLAAETKEALMARLASLKASENIFVFWQSGLPKSQDSLFKSLLSQDKKFVQNFTAPSGLELNNWVKKYLKDQGGPASPSQGGQISPAALNLLITVVGNNLWQLHNELDKLLALANGRPIDPSDVQELVQAKFNSNIFNLVDALANNQAAQAVKLLNEQLALGLGEIYILSMIIRQFRILVKLKSCLEQKLNSIDIATTTKLHPFEIKKLGPAAAKISWDKLKNIYQKLLKLEHRYKTTSLPPQTLLDLFILEI